MTIPELEQQLAEAQARRGSILTKLSKAGSGLQLSDALAADDAISDLQRQIAAAKGEEYAVPVNLRVKPDPPGSSPVLLQTDYETFLLFYVSRRKRNGHYANPVRAVVEIINCDITKFGYPNDEALPGDPLYSKGLRSYGVYEVVNSSWIKELTRINRVRFPDTKDSKQKHFIFTFHDSTFECVARKLKATITDKSYETLLAELGSQVLR